MASQGSGNSGKAVIAENEDAMVMRMVVMVMMVIMVMLSLDVPCCALECAKSSESFPIAVLPPGELHREALVQNQCFFFSIVPDTLKYLPVYTYAT